MCRTEHRYQTHLCIIPMNDATNSIIMEMELLSEKSLLTLRHCHMTRRNAKMCHRLQASYIYLHVCRQIDRYMTLRNITVNHDYFNFEQIQIYCQTGDLVSTCCMLYDNERLFCYFILQEIYPFCSKFELTKLTQFLLIF